MNSITLPPIKHLFKNLFDSTNEPYNKEKNTAAINAARSLQQLSLCCNYPTASTPVNSSSGSVLVATSCQYCSAIGKAPSCYCVDSTSSTRSHRRTVSATLEMSATEYRHHPYRTSSTTAASNVVNTTGSTAPYYRHYYLHHSPQQQPKTHSISDELVGNTTFRRARAHTTSGYPPTMLFEPIATNHKPTLPSSPPSITIASCESSPQHQQSHRYHCHHCRKSFSRPSSLRIHTYSHTGEKPFKCQYQGCGRSFSVHSNMRRHLRVHYYPQHQQQQHSQRESTTATSDTIKTTTTSSTVNHNDKQIIYHHHNYHHNYQHQLTNSNNSMRLPIAPTGTLSATVHHDLATRDSCYNIL